MILFWAFALQTLIHFVRMYILSIFQSTIIQKISETNSNFRVAQSTTGRV